MATLAPQPPPPRRSDAAADKRRSLLTRMRDGLRPEQAPLDSSLARAHAHAARLGGSTPDLGDGGGADAHKGGRRRFWGGRRPAADVTPSLPQEPPVLSLAFDDEPPPAQLQPAPALSATAQTPAQAGKAQRPATADVKRSASAAKRRSVRRSVDAQPTPAAAVALAVKAKPATPAQRLDAHRTARLSVPQAQELFALCAQEIRMRGLATVGIFRPFRLAESPERVERFVELFLLHSEPDTYSRTFSVFETNAAPVSSALYLDTLGRPDAHQELLRSLSYANIHDVVGLFKWGLRRLRLRASDLNSSDQYGWYNTFVEAEKSAGYPSRAFSELLLPALPKPTAQLLADLFDLLGTVSAHHITNAMPAHRICRSVSFWLWGRGGGLVDHPPSTLEELLAACERASLVTEHLLLAHIRDQAACVHSMPTRLLELVQSYPYLAEGGNAPSLPPAFRGREQRALRIKLRTENVALSAKRPRTPSDTLRAACGATVTDTESSAEVDDWAAIVAYAALAPDVDAVTELRAGPLAEGLSPLSQTTHMANAAPARATSAMEDEHSADMRREFALGTEEDARILRITADVLAARRAVLDPPEKPVLPLPEPAKPQPWSDSMMQMPKSDSAQSLTGRTSLHSSGSVSEFGATGPARVSLDPAAGMTTSGSLRGRTNLVTLEEDDASWKDFSASGFATNGAAPTDLQLTEVLAEEMAAPAAEARPVARRQSSFSSVGRRGNRKSKSVEPFEGPVAPPPPPVYTVTRVATMGFDEALVALWQDQLLDPAICASFPPLLFMQLNSKTASRILTAGMGTQASSWLCIEEHITPPRPALPPSHAGGHYRDRSDATSERRSLFAPSLRSISNSLFRASGLRRVASYLPSKSSRSDSKQPPTSADAVQASASARTLDTESESESAAAPRSSVPASPARAAERTVKRKPVSSHGPVAAINGASNGIQSHPNGGQSHVAAPNSMMAVEPERQSERASSQYVDAQS